MFPGIPNPPSLWDYTMAGAGIGLALAVIVIEHCSGRQIPRPFLPFPD